MIQLVKQTPFLELLLLAGWDSGYNEVIVNSHKYNEHLPDVVEAFFMLRANETSTDPVLLENEKRVVKAHQEFLELYQKTAEEVPLLVLDPLNLDEPFTLAHPLLDPLRYRTH